MKNAHDTDIREMLDLVAQQMKYYENEFGDKQSSTYEVRSFYKKLFFNPGLFKESELPRIDPRRLSTGPESTL